jgi:hypoxanthine phosphoribosyltransferase
MAEPPFAGSRLVASPESVRAAWDRLAAGIQPHVDDGSCLLIGVMIGGVVPLVHVTARLRGDVVIDYCHLTRYGGATTGGGIQWVHQPRQVMAGRTVILMDDIFDEGHTLADLRAHCLAQGAARVLVAVLARKLHRREVVGPAPDLVGLEVPDAYVFGCGMDYRDHWRHLDAIYALAPAAEPGEGAV